MPVLLLYVVVGSYFNVQPWQGSPTGSLWFLPECRVRPPRGPARSRSTHKRLVLCESPAGPRKDIKSKKKMLLTSVRSCCGGLLAVGCWQAARMAFAKNTRAETCWHLYIFALQWIHTCSILISLYCKSVCIWGGMTFLVSCPAACLIFPLSSPSQRNLTL